MKLLRTLTLLLTGLLFSLSVSAQKTTEPVAYRLVDSVGRPVTFDKLITRAAGADVVFFGELHNNPISHWMQLRVLEALQQRKGKNLTLGLEMLEADIQLILDEYLAKTISPKSYGDEARLWPNYETDYDPVVYFAKDHGLRVIATNVPRRYADLVNRKGLPALDSLSAEAKRYLPPLPIAFQSTEQSAGMFAAMGALVHGDKKKEKRYLEEAQAIKDATMGYRISQHLRPQHTFLHLNGSYHSLQNGGIIPYLSRYAPKTRIVTITTVLQEDVEALEEAYHGMADFILIVPEDMTRTH